MTTADYKEVQYVPIYIPIYEYRHAWKILLKKLFKEQKTYQGQKTWANKELRENICKIYHRILIYKGFSEIMREKG